MAKKQTAGRDRLGSLAPKFAELNDDVLFGEVWSREDKLSPRDRSMVTIAALFRRGCNRSSKAILIWGRNTVLRKQRQWRSSPSLLFTADGRRRGALSR